MNDLAWLDAALRSARPQAIGALLRYFRNLDQAEEAFQEACLRALKHWPVNGPPRDPTAWLILVGRNTALDEVRRRKRDAPLPEEAAISNLEDAESNIAERLDNLHYRDDMLRLLFICCHPDLPATQQIALALRIVSGLSPFADTLVNAFTDATNGALTVRSKGLTDKKKRMDDQINQLEDRADQYRERLVAQFAAMEKVVSGLKALGNFITSQDNAKKSE